MRVLTIVLLCFGIVSAAAASEEPAVIRVTGQGEVAAAPDMATITLGVVSNAATAAQAMAETSDKTAAILAALADSGIAKADIQTSDLSLSPVWSNRNYDGGTPRIEGFTARNMVRLRVRDLGTLGSLLDQVLQVGGNSFQGLAFGLQDPQPQQDAALADAVKDAARKAALIAEAAGVPLGPIVSISEAGGRPPQPVMMMEARAASVPVAEGEVSLTATVSVEFAIGE